MNWVAQLIPLMLLSAGILTVVAVIRRRYAPIRWMVPAACGLSCLASLILTGLMISAGESPIVVEIFDWLFLSGDSPLRARFALQVDSLAVVMLSTVTCASVVVAIQAVDHKSTSLPHPSFLLLLIFQMFCMSMFVLSSNLFQSFVFWELLAAGTFFSMEYDNSGRQGSHAGKIFLINHVTDIGFLFALLLLWRHFGTFDFSDVFSQAAILRVTQSNPSAIAGICLGLLFSVAGRCGQFPFLFGVRRPEDGTTAVTALMHSVTLFPAGVFLLIRCTPLFAAAPSAQLTMAALGGTTAVMLAVVALTQDNARQLLALSTPALFGFMLLGLGAGAGAGIAAAAFLFFVHNLVKAPMFFAAEDVSRLSQRFTDSGRSNRRALFRSPELWLLIVGCIVLASGIWGQTTIIDVLSMRAAELAADEHNLGEFALRFPSFVFDSQSVFDVLFWMALLALCLTAFCFCRVICREIFVQTAAANRVPQTKEYSDNPLTHSEESESQSDLVSRSARIKMWSRSVPVMLAFAAAPILGIPTGLFDRFLGRTLPTAAVAHTFDMLTVGTTTLAVLLGLAAAWFVSIVAVQPSKRATELLEPCARLCRRRFYIEEVLRFVMISPLRLLAQLCRLLDERLLEYGPAGSVRRMLQEIHEAAEPVHNQSLQFYTLGILLTTAVLLLTLIW